MKNHTWKAVAICVAAIAAVVFAANRADAGAKQESPVGINNNLRMAFGAMGTARNSSDSQQFIGCTYQSDSAANQELSCSAKAADGTFASCHALGASVTQFLYSYMAINSDSYLSFAWDAGKNCIEIDVYNYSYYTPKQP